MSIISGKRSASDPVSMRITETYAEEQYAKFNALCFGGSLPDIPIVITKARSYLGKVTFKRSYRFFCKTEYSDFKMRLSTYYDLPEEELQDILIHEMIHFCILSRNIKDTSAHGREFRRMMKTINSVYGRHISISYKIK